MRVLPTPDNRVEGSPTSCAPWSQRSWTFCAPSKPVLSPPDDTHPLGCHRRRAPDRLCSRGILIRLVTGSSWVDIEATLDHQVSDTTLRTRRDEWIGVGVFDQLKMEALAAFDRMVGLDLDDVSLDGSLHKAPTAVKEPARTPKIVGSVDVVEEPGRLHSCISTGATTPEQFVNGSSRLASGTSTFSCAAPRTRLRRSSRSGSALDRRSHQLLALELRLAPTQHRPTITPPTRRPLPRHGRTHHRPTSRLPRPMGPRRLTPIRSGP